MTAEQINKIVHYDMGNNLNEIIRMENCYLFTLVEHEIQWPLRQTNLYNFNNNNEMVYSYPVRLIQSDIAENIKPEYSEDSNRYKSFKNTDGTYSVYEFLLDSNKNRIYDVYDYKVIISFVF